MTKKKQTKKQDKKVAEIIKNNKMQEAEMLGLSTVDSDTGIDIVDGKLTHDVEPSETIVVDINELQSITDAPTQPQEDSGTQTIEPPIQTQPLETSGTIAEKLILDNETEAESDARRENDNPISLENPNPAHHEIFINPDEKPVYSFPSRSRCPRCQATDTQRISSKGKIQYRKCLRAICRKNYTIQGEIV